MIPANYDDYRELARRRLPRMLFDYVDGGAYAETTLRRSVEAFQEIRLRQRVMRDVSELSLATELFGEKLAMPLLLAPVGMAGFFSRQGEVKAARAAAGAGIAACLSTVSVFSIEAVAKAKPPWFQLYMVRDRGFMRELLARAREHAAPVLVFTVDLPVPGTRYRDVRSSLTGELGAWGRVKRAFDGVTHPAWAFDVMRTGTPTFGNLTGALSGAKNLGEYWTWIRANFDPTVTWADLEWVRDQWPGPIVIKGILDTDDARAAVKAGVEGIVVSNHGGRQLDGAPASIEALPAIVDAVGGDLTVLMDGGIRSGLDVVKAMALGAKGCLIGRPWAFALGARGEAGVAHMLRIMRGEMQVAMALTGCTDITKAGRDMLA